MFVRLSHVGILVRDLEKAIDLWANTYDLKTTRRGTIPEEGCYNAILPIGNNSLELIQPINPQDTSPGPEHAIARRLARHGEGLYQIALVVDDIQSVGEKLTRKGVTLIGRPALRGSTSRLVVHPSSASGALLELIGRPMGNP